MISFNQPYLTGKETHYMYQAVQNLKLSGNGEFTKKCQQFFMDRYGFKKCLLTTSGTDALEMCAMLCDLKPGDEVIVPSYTFVSTALAFLREGAKVVFADSMKRNPNLDAETLESLITPRTKVIAPVHYAGVACDMDAIMAIAEKHNLLVVEDAAQAIDSYYFADKKGINGRLMANYTNINVPAPADKVALPLGGVGHLAAFSFHETKNVTAGGEGGLLVVNDERFIRRAEILWEKGTNRAEFFRGAVNKYGWVDMGSSFLPAEINAAFLWAQLENLDNIQSKRLKLWNKYYELLSPITSHPSPAFRLPDLPAYATNNAHMFYLVCHNLEERTGLIQYLKDNGVQAPFHYLSLHQSDYYQKLLQKWNDHLPITGETGEGANGCPSTGKPTEGALPECDRYADTLVRLPMFYELEEEQVEKICELIKEYYNK